MNFKIVQEQDVPLLARKEILLHLSFDKIATPTKADVTKNLSTYLKAAENTISLQHIYQVYGKNEAHVAAYVYNKEEDLKRIETINKKKKQEKKEEAKK